MSARHPSARARRPRAPGGPGQAEAARTCVAWRDCREGGRGRFARRVREGSSRYARYHLVTQLLRKTERKRMSTAVTTQTFEQEALQSEKPVIVDFWTEW